MLHQLEKTSNSKTNINIIFTILFLFILLYPLLEDMSKGESIKVEDFQLKDLLITTINDMKFSVFKDRVFSGLIVGDEDWLLYNAENHFDDYQNTYPLTQTELRFIDEKLNFLCSEMTNLKIKLIVMVPPNKNSIYPEYVPNSIQKINDSSRYDQISELITPQWEDNEGCVYIDLREDLIKAKQDRRVYYSTDTHWNSYGAFIAYQNFASLIQKDFPHILVHSLTDYSIKNIVYKGDMTSNDFGHFSIVEISEKLEPNFIQKHRLIELETISNISTHSSQTGDKNLPSAIFYHDSFTNTLIPYIADLFFEAKYYWSFTIDMEEIIRKRPDYLIIIPNERALYPALMSLPSQ